jgi:hypothetical protein
MPKMPKVPKRNSGALEYWSNGKNRYLLFVNPQLPGSAESPTLLLTELLLTGSF